MANYMKYTPAPNPTKPSTQAAIQPNGKLALEPPLMTGVMLPVGPGYPERLENVVPLYTGRPIGLGDGVMVSLPMTISGTPTEGNVMFFVTETEVDAGVVYCIISLCFETARGALSGKCTHQGNAQALLGERT